MKNNTLIVLLLILTTGCSSIQPSDENLKYSSTEKKEIFKSTQKIIDYTNRNFCYRFDPCKRGDYKIFTTNNLVIITPENDQIVIMRALSENFTLQLTRSGSYHETFSYKSSDNKVITNTQTLSQNEEISTIFKDIESLL